MSAWLDQQEVEVVPPDTTDADTQLRTSAKELLGKIKDAGVAGVISFALVQMAFGGLGAVCVVAYSLFTGHVPDWRDQEDMAQFGAGAFAWVNVARFAAPLASARHSPPCHGQENIVDRLSRANAGKRTSAQACE